MSEKKRLFFFVTIAILSLCQFGNPASSQTKEGTSSQIKPAFGGRLVVSKTAGPRSFNRLLSIDDQTNTVTDCLMGHLIRINRQTQQPEPELARSWSISPDGNSITFSLRRGVKFSDGRPFTADDVIFTFQLINDTKIASPVSDQFNFDGRPVEVIKKDDYTIVFKLPAPYANAIRLFDGIPLLPRHALEQVYREGKFEHAWTLATAADRIIGLGPFKLKEYVANQRIILQRNENYWKSDESGRRLPYLDEIIFVIDPDRNTQLLKFQRGETDILNPVNAEDTPALLPLEKQGKIRVFNLGPGMIREVFWFNLNNGKNKTTGQNYVDPIKLEWFNKKNFRQAISHAIDRHAIVKLAFTGKADPQWAYLSAGDKLWFNPGTKKYPYSIDRAKELLADAGFRYVPVRKALLDPRGREVNFTLITNANPMRQKMAALIQEDLAQIGIRMNIATIESRALLSRIDDSFNYEACLLAIASGDTDPASNVNILYSNGPNHWWNPGQTSPQTAWEALLDKLTKQQMTTRDPRTRKRIFNQAQEIMAEQQPFIFLAARHLIVAAKTEIGNIKPALLPDYVLWNCEELYRK